MSATAEVAVPYPKALAQFPTIRQSTLAAFDNCGLAAHFEDIYRHGWSTHPQARGSIFHSVAARCFREMSQQGEEQIPVDVALDILHEVLRQDEVDRECPKCLKREIRPGIVDGMRTCGACGHRFETQLMNLPMREVRSLYWTIKKWASETRWSIENLVDVEQRLWMTVSYPNPRGDSEVERRLTGQLDAFFVEGHRDSHAIVVDHKDTWALPAPTEVSFDGYFQQRFYGALVMSQAEYRSIDRVTLREFYPRYSEAREVTIWRDDLADVLAEFAALAERFDRAVEEAVFVPTPGKHCSYCIRPGACPIFPEARGQGRIQSQADAEVVAARIAVAESYLAQGRDAAASWADVHGPIPMRDAKGRRALGHHEVKRTRRPTREELESAIREHGGRTLDLDALYPTTRGTRFEQHVPPRVVESDDDARLLANLEGAVAEAKAQRTEDAEAGAES